MGTQPKNHSSVSFAATPTISFMRVVSRLSEVPKGGEKASLCNTAVFCCLRHKCAPTLMAFCNSRRNSMPPSFRFGYPTRLPIQSPRNGRFAPIRIRRERFVQNSFQIQPNVTLLSRAESTIQLRPGGRFPAWPAGTPGPKPFLFSATWDFLPILQPANRYFLWQRSQKLKNQYYRKDVRFMSLSRPELVPARFFDNFERLTGLFMLAVVKRVATFLFQRT